MKKLPPLKAVPVFVEVAENLSFSKAAEKLFVTHSAVSQNIKQLESFFDKKLFNRENKVISLTEFGERFYLKARESIRILEEATKFELKKINEINIQCISSLAIKWLIPIFPEMKQAFPDLNIKITTPMHDYYTAGDTSKPSSKEIIMNSDISILYGKKEDFEQVNSRLFFEDELILVCAPSVTQLNNLQDILNKYPKIVVDVPFREDDWAFWNANMKLLETPEDNNILFQTSLQAIQAAIAGLGIFVTHKAFVIDELKNGLLINLNTKKIVPDYHYYLIMDIENRQKKTLDLVEWLYKKV